MILLFPIYLCSTWDNVNQWLIEYLNFFILIWPAYAVPAKGLLYSLLTLTEEGRDLKYYTNVLYGIFICNFFLYMEILEICVRDLMQRLLLRFLLNV